MATSMASFGEKQFGQAELGDRRRTKCLARLADRIYRHPGGTLPIKLHEPKDYKAMVRLMNQATVTHDSVLAPHRQQTREQLRQTTQVRLVIHDTTELDYSGLHSITDLGRIGNGGGRGFLCHNSLAVDPERRTVIGLVNQILHRRRHVGRKEGVRAKRERRDRESRLWLQGLTALGAAPEGCQWVHVADRGADTFEFLAGVRALGQHLLVRSQTNRVVLRGHHEQADRDHLHTYARALPLQGRAEVVVPARNGQGQRKATVGVAFAPVLLQPPHVRRGLYEKRPVALWLVRVSEIEPPRGAKPVEWILLTSIKVASLEEAWERVEWYKCRWIVEEFHKAQKTGCGVEDLQFTTSQALEPMIALLSVVAVSLLNLREASRQPDAEQRRATDLVAECYVRVLSRWRYKKDRADLSVHEFFYALARLGGHQNRKGDHRPGWLVLWRGWMALQQMMDGAEAVGFKTCG
jgi:hypothetical protein